MVGADSVQPLCSKHAADGPMVRSGGVNSDSGTVGVGTAGKGPVGGGVRRVSDNEERDRSEEWDYKQAQGGYVKPTQGSYLRSLVEEFVKEGKDILPTKVRKEEGDPGGGSDDDIDPETREEGDSG